MHLSDVSSIASCKCRSLKRSTDRVDITKKPGEEEPHATYTTCSSLSSSLLWILYTLYVASVGIYKNSSEGVTVCGMVW